MNARTPHTDLPFLAGGGEMGELTRTKNWSQTSLGDPANWPQSLRTTLSILLNSKFPMFLWWGPELICFYNDAYRPSLGTNGKHPFILGERAEIAWAEIWSIINPLIDQVLAGGESTWSEDQLIPIFRNGKIEDVYWTFSYSPVNDESGKVSGVLVTCNETTEKVNMFHQLQASEQRFRHSVQQAPLGITILRGNRFIVEIANPTYLLLVDKKEKDFIGKPLFDSLPEVREIVEPLLTNVITTGNAFHASELSVTLNRYGKEELAYFNLVYHPLREESGEISGIMVVATEVTSTVNAKLALAESEKQFRNLVMQSPIPMTIFRGEDYVIEMANTMMFENIWRKKEAEVLGKKALEVFPELNDQKYPGLLREVYTTGKMHSEKESIALVEGADGMKKFYLDFEYAPLLEPDGSISGIIITVNDVTEKVTARMQLEESELQFRTMAERLNLVIEASELGTWEWQVKTDEVSYSDRYLKIFGYKDPSNLNHDKLLAHLHPDDKQLRDSAVKEAFRQGSLDYKARIIWKDGSLHWIEAKGKVFYDDQQEVEKLIGTVRDITEEKYRQQELFENEQRFRLLADSLPQHIWTADTEGTLNYFNESVYNYSGLTVEQLDTDGWLQIVHPDDREENIRLWTESILTGKDFLFEHRFRRHDGEYRWQLSRAIPQKNAEGTIQMWVGTSTDIQEQKMFTSELEKQVRERTKELLELNESLAKSEERYHLMVEEVEDYAILYLNREGMVENWNKGAEKIKGYRADEIIGKSFSEFYTPEDRQNGLPEKLLHLATTTGKTIQEGWRVRKDGSYFWASVAITAVHDSQNHVIGFSKVTHNLTEKKTADDKLKLNAEQLEQKNKDLEKINSELKSFAYVSSHDLQEPLRKIQTFASRILLKEAEALTENGKDYFRRMQEAAGRMQTLIQDLLAYSRTNITDRTFENTNLLDIVNEVKRELKETIIEKNATIETGNMCYVNIIPFQFRQLLLNLVGNALKFSNPGIPPHIIIQSEIVKENTNPLLSPEKKYCRISVTDNGIGFDPQYKERIFEVFQRLHGKSEYSGTGIGLAIVKKIVENHNGIIIATSELNHGAKFDIYIPD